MDRPIVLYDKIGKSYNTGRRADPYLLGRIMELLKPEKKGLYLDIGCGTGNYTKALAELEISMLGIDPSEEMLESARSKAPHIIWLNGKAEMIPAKDEMFDGVLATFTLHHWKSPGNGFSELARVLKPGGRFLLLTSTPGQMQGYWLNHYFPDMMSASMAVMPSQEQIVSWGEKAGFHLLETESYEVQESLSDHVLYSGKHNPAMYFDSEIRKGISSFVALSNEKEVENGLQLLKKDIETGYIEFIRNQYDNRDGDYLFVVLQKNIP